MRSIPLLLSILLFAAVSSAQAAIPAGFAGSAYLKLRRVALLEGQDHGLAYATHRSLVDSCNSLRAAFYGLPPVQIDPSVLRSLDEQTVEKYYQDGRAATFITARGLRLTDFQRWTAEQRLQPRPASPPDCAQYELSEVKTGTLWRDGWRYQLDWSRQRAVGVPAAADQQASLLMPAAQFERQPEESYLGRPCRRVLAPTREFMDGTACIWSDYPFVSWLNWPWALEATRRIGLPQKLRQTDTVLQVERNGVIPPGVFEIPAGFTITPAPR